MTTLLLPTSAAGVSAATLPTQVATGLLSLTWLLIALPLAGAGFLLLGGRRTNRWGHWLATACSGAAFVVGALLLVQLLGRPAHERALTQHLFTWMQVGGFQVDASLRLDPLSLAFVLLVSFVGSLIHVYSIGYMAHDVNRRRFFAYLNLFVAAMLTLVLADNYLVLFLGWEGVGLASYLLIGFWSHNPVYAAAAKKAFIANRIGDVGLLVALFLLWHHVGSLNYSQVFAAVPHLPSGVTLALGLLLLLGACGKSAQVPLQSWLGDAMAGPTPVSALIHAATMVTAGVYLVVRSGPIFEASPTAQLAVAVVGAVTLLFGAIVGCAKDDIKKALAASTMSQIGYMMLAAGLGPAGYVFAIFHLLTHGFFKAGLFLGAGSVMHAMGDTVDMRRYGALAREIPLTTLTFGAGWLAIIGFPFLSGYFSKDLIIEAALNQPGWRGWVFGGSTLLGAMITAFYMTRVMILTFAGSKRWNEGEHPHESPLWMTIPMVILAVGSVGLGGLLVWGDRFQRWLDPVVPIAHHSDPTLPVWVVTLITLLLVTAGAGLAWWQYGNREIPLAAPTAVSALTKAARRDLYQDAVNEALLMRPGQYLTRALVLVDNRGVDGSVNGSAAFMGGTSARLRRLHTGQVRWHAFTVAAGALVFLGLAFALVWTTGVW